MARLHRPYVPLKVRVKVAERQLRETKRTDDATAFLLRTYGELMTSTRRATYKTRLKVILAALFGVRSYALDHDPALVNRKRYVRNGKTFYIPPANSSNFLRYREAGPGSDHDIKTRVRGDGAQRSDLGQRRYLKNVEKGREKRKRAPSRKRGERQKVRHRLKRPWPSRPFPKRSDAGAR